MPVDIDFDIDPESTPPPLVPEIMEEKEKLPVLAEISTQEVAARLFQYEQEIALMEQRSRTITIIKDDATNVQAAEWGQQAKKLWKKLEELRKYFTAPHVKYERKVNAFFKQYMDPLKNIDETMGRLESAYDRLKENERRIQQAQAEKAARELQEKLDEEARQAAAKGVEYEPVIVEPQIIPEAPKITRTSYGSSSQRSKWTCTIIEADKVPREYCTPDQRLLNEALKAGVRKIEGCEIEDKAKTVRRV